jgi:hypothetical protein
MDTATIATVATTLLSPVLSYLLKGGEKAIEEAGKKVGTDAWEKAKSIWAKLYPKVKEEPAALKAAESLAQKPADQEAQNALSTRLTEILDQDEELAHQIASITLYDSSTSATAGGEGSSAFAGKDIDRSQIISGGSFNITGDANIIGQNNYSQVSKAAPTGARRTPDEFGELLEQLREELRKAHMDDKTRRSIEADIRAVETEAEDSSPSLLIIEAKLKGIESIINRVEAAGTATRALTPLIRRTIESAGRLFL